MVAEYTYQIHARRKQTKQILKKQTILPYSKIYTSICYIFTIEDSCQILENGQTIYRCLQDSFTSYLNTWIKQRFWLLLTFLGTQFIHLINIHTILLQTEVHSKCRHVICHSIVTKILSLSESFHDIYSAEILDIIDLYSQTFWKLNTQINRWN